MPRRWRTPSTSTSSILRARTGSTRPTSICGSRSAAARDTMTEQAPRGHGAELSKQMGYLPLVAVIFFTVSGGAYGLESLVGPLEAGWAMALIVISSLVWAVPIVVLGM